MKVEWNIDFDDFEIRRKVDGKDVIVKSKFRCNECWGNVQGRMDDVGKYTGMRCRVCGMLVVRQASQDEFERTIEGELVDPE